MIKEHSAGAVIYGNFLSDETKFLLLHHTSGHWDFPKGNVEEGESEVETVIREIFEETGITAIRFVEGFVRPVFYSYKRGGSLVQKNVTFYLVHTLTKSVTLSNEHQGFLWVDYHSALMALTYRSARDILLSANKFIKGRETK